MILLHFGGLVYVLFLFLEISKFASSEQTAMPFSVLEFEQKQISALEQTAMPFSVPKLKEEQISASKQTTRPFSVPEFEQKQISASEQTTTPFSVPKFQQKPIDENQIAGQFLANSFLRLQNQFIRNEISRVKNEMSRYRYIELALVVDYSICKQMNFNTTEIYGRYKDVVNVVNGLFQKFKIFVALVNIEIWCDGDKVEINKNAEITYSIFQSYYKNLQNNQTDIVQLISNTEFNVNDVPFGKICNGLAIGVISDSSENITEIAKQLGENFILNFGISWSRKSCTNIFEKCQNPSRDCIGFLKWTTCGTQTMPENLMLECLKNQPEKLFEGPVCGNTFEEEGEACDCGLPEQCSDRNCDAKTCKTYSVPHGTAQSVTPTNSTKKPTPKLQTTERTTTKRTTTERTTTEFIIPQLNLRPRTDPAALARWKNIAVFGLILKICILTCLLIKKCTKTQEGTKTHEGTLGTQT